MGHFQLNKVLSITYKLYYVIRFKNLNIAWCNWLMNGSEIIHHYDVFKETREFQSIYICIYLFYCYMIHLVFINFCEFLNYNITEFDSCSFTTKITSA